MRLDARRGVDRLARSQRMRRHATDELLGRWVVERWGARRFGQIWCAGERSGSWVVVDPNGRAFETHERWINVLATREETPPLLEVSA